MKREITSNSVEFKFQNILRRQIYINISIIIDYMKKGKQKKFNIHGRLADTFSNDSIL